MLCACILTMTSHYVRSSVEFSICGIMSAVLKKIDLEHFEFQGFRLGMLNLYSHFMGKVI